MPKKPLLFLKPTSSYLPEGKSIQIPRGCKEFYHEVELGVIINKKACDVPENKAMDYVGGYVLALDMTARDFISDAKKNGHPWLLAKGFDTSCPVGKFIPKEKIADPHNVNLWLSVNGDMKQNGFTDCMVFRIPTLLAYITQYITLERGDVVLTGTPAGSGAVKDGDVIEAGIGDVERIKFDVESK